MLLQHLYGNDPVVVCSVSSNVNILNLVLYILCQLLLQYSMNIKYFGDKHRIIYFFIFDIW